MLNRDGIRKEGFGVVKQILADVQHQSSVGCIVDNAMGVAVGNRKIVKAGTPINIDLMNLQTKCSAAGAGKPMNAVLLHDVDVTSGKDANGTALVFGTVNVNRVDSDVQTLITAAAAEDGASPLLLFGKF